MGASRRLAAFVVAAVVAAGAGCTDTPNSKPLPTGTSATQTVSWLEQQREADILFMMDNAGSKAAAQANLRTNLASFMDVLKNLPGGLPDLHIAIVTSDLGAGDGTSIAGCSVSGEAGKFRFQAGLGCTATGLDANSTYIVDTGGTNPTTNFGTMDITNVLECIITVGSTGCGFQQQLGAVTRALGADGAAAPPENDGFLRTDAVLAIVLLTSEDDCSHPAGSPLFDPTSSMLASTYGPTENFLCNEWGHLCLSPTTGQWVQPSRLAPNNAVTDTVTYSPAAGPNNCQSFEASPVMTPVGTMADGIKSLKADPANQILVAALAGPAIPYTVGWRTPPVPDTGPWPEIMISCGVETQATGFAAPAVRIEQFVRQFGDNGLVDSYCQNNYGPSLGTIATRLGELVRPPPGCFDSPVATKPNSSTPDCAVIEKVPTDTLPEPVPIAVPFCDASGAVPCWTIDTTTAGPACVGGRVAVNWGVPSAAPPPGATISASCAICVPGLPDPVHHCS